jgi:glycosyltransferase involved in cell wall biosynthesis
MRIGYVGLFHFPDGNAGAVHAFGVGKALREYGHSVTFFGVERSAQSVERPLASTETSSYSGFTYRSPEPAGAGIIGKQKQRVSIATGASFLQRLNAEEASSGPFDAIMVYHPQSLWIFRLRSWCRSRKIPMICDVVEWFDRSHIRGGRYGYHALDSEFRMRMGHGLSDGVLAISTYLANYYSNRGVPTLCVPNIVDVSEGQWAEAEALSARTGMEKLRLVFVGTAGQKDLLVNAIRGLSLLGPEKCEIVVVGPSREEIRAELGGDSSLLEVLHESLHFTGRLPRTEALRQLAQADFSILLRPDARFAHAGFPTKLVESLAMGVPVICTLTSDIGLYVKDGCEGIVVPDCSPRAFADGVSRILALSLDERYSMRLHAKKRAIESFDYRNWAKPLGEFVGRVTDSVRQKNKPINGS